MPDDDVYGEDGYQPDEGQGGDSQVYGYDPSQNRDYDTLPCIVYRAEVEEWERVTAGTGTEQFCIRFRIKGPDAHDGRCIFWRTNIGPKYDWTRKGYFAAIGYDVEKPFQWTPAQQIGREVGILLEHQKGRDRIFEKPKEFYPPNDPRVPGHEEYA